MTVALITSRRSTQYNADPPRANIVAILILLGVARGRRRC